MVTHDLDSLYAICDRVAVLAEKRVLVEGPIEEMTKVDHPWVQEYFTGPGPARAQKKGRIGKAMETRANYILIGAFTIAGILGAFGFFLWLAKFEVSRQYAYYDVLSKTFRVCPPPAE